MVVDIAQNYEALRSIKIRRATLTKITKNAIAAVHKDYLRAELVRNKFSISFDEFTDINTVKHGSIVVRFFNSELKNEMSALWEIIPIYNTGDEENDATSGVIYDRLQESFGRWNEIPRENVQSFCSDNCSTMVGLFNSVAQRFARDFPEIFYAGCPCQ